MTTKEIICTVCPIGCVIKVCGEGDKIGSVTGNNCKRGETFAINEFSHPVRILTSTVKVVGGKNPLVAVRSNKPVPKELIFHFMEEIKKAEIKAPVKTKDVIISNILDTGIDIVATGHDE